MSTWYIWQVFSSPIALICDSVVCVCVCVRVRACACMCVVCVHECVFVLYALNFESMYI